MRELERQVLLQVMDRKWREHLYEMDYLKEGIGLRAMAQRDPLIEYQREGFDMFAAMLEGIKEETVTHLFHVRVQAATPPAPEAPAEAPRARRRSRRPSGPLDDSVTQTRPNPVVAPAAGAHRPDPGRGGQRCGAARGARERRRRDHRRPAHGVRWRHYPPPERAAVQRACRGRRHHTRTRSGNAPAAPGRAAGRSGAPGEPARNRPCPCGSGRKYKHCHGAPTVAHPDGRRSGRPRPGLPGPASQQPQDVTHRQRAGSSGRPSKRAAIARARPRVPADRGHLDRAHARVGCTCTDVSRDSERAGGAPLAART